MRRHSSLVKRNELRYSGAERNRDEGRNLIHLICGTILGSTTSSLARHSTSLLDVLRASAAVASFGPHPTATISQFEHRILPRQGISVASDSMHLFRSLVLNNNSAGTNPTKSLRSSCSHNATTWIDRPWELPTAHANLSASEGSRGLNLFFRVSRLASNLLLHQMADSPSRW